MFKIMEEEEPSHMMVAFDEKAPTFRHKMYEEYKGTRKPMPEELQEQMPVIKDILKAMNICILSKEGIEADDILGTMARRGRRTVMRLLSYQVTGIFSSLPQIRSRSGFQRQDPAGP